jgi:hypothetical protein
MRSQRAVTKPATLPFRTGQYEGAPSSTRARQHEGGDDAAEGDAAGRGGGGGTKRELTVVVNAPSNPSQSVQGVGVSLSFVAGSDRVIGARDATNRAGQALLLVTPLTS